MKGRYILLLLVCLLAVSCEGWLCPEKKKTFDRVMILYSAGCNSLSRDLENNIKDLKQGYIPKKNDKKALIIVSHLSYGKDTYSPQTNSYIIRLYKKKSTVVSDTLKTVAAGKFLTQPSVMNEILGYVKDSFKSEHYGMVFSSHATGWLPQGYFKKPSDYDSSVSSGTWSLPRRFQNLPEGAVPYHELDYPEWLPKVKSVGQEDTMNNGAKISYEMNMIDFATNIPMHLDYLVFDACLMGGIEVAYELRSKCNIVAFSPTEVLSEGHNYKTMASHLLEVEPDLYKLCKDFYDKFNNRSNDPFATITLVNCSKLDKLAMVCQNLFSTYRDALANVDPAQVQPYFQFQKHWFYDLEDIFDKADISYSDKISLDNALKECIVYKAATPKFITITINTYSGFSMYLPCNGSPYLDEYYKTLAWNKATGLVQ